MTQTLDRKRAILTEQVTQTRRRLRRNGVWAGAALLALLAVAWLTLAAVVDALVALPVAGRVTAWAAWWGIVVVIGAAAVLWPAVRPMRLERVAFHIERTLGRMHNRLVTVLDLARAGEGRGGQRGRAPDAWAVQRLVDQTWRRMEGYRPAFVADARLAVWLSAAAGVVGLVLVVLLVSFYEPMSTAIARIAAPTRPIAPASWVRFDVGPGDVEVLHGEPVTIHADLVRGSLEADAVVSLRLEDEDGRTVRYPMQAGGSGAAGARFVFTLESVERSYRYRVEAGRAWEGPYRIERIDRPRLDRLAAQVALPAYLGDVRPRPVAEPGETIDAVRGATILLEAHVHGAVSAATIDLLEARMETVEVAEREQRTWFDDALPADARTTGRWHWVDTPVRSGRRAHTFRWDRAPYGFRTWLDPLMLEAEESFYVFVRVDEREPAERLRVTLKLGDAEERAFVWGAEAAGADTVGAGADAGDEGAVDGAGEAGEAGEADEAMHMGPVPAPGQWHRLAIPRAKIVEGDEGEVALAGVRFAVEGGQVTFDRAGAMREVVRERERRVYELVETLAMSPGDGGGGVWRGRIVVGESDLWYRVGLVNEHGLTNPPMQPAPILATRDQAPGLRIDQPARHVSLAEPRPVPLVIRAYDDYGVSKVLLQTASTREALDSAEGAGLEALAALALAVDGGDDAGDAGEVGAGDVRQQVLARYAEPRTSRTVAEAMSPGRFGLDEGEAIYYRAVVLDAKGQHAASPTFRFAYESVDAQAPAGRTMLSRMLDDMGELVALDEAVGEAMGAMMSALPSGVTLDLERERVTLVDEHGRPLDAAAVAEAMAGWQAALTAMEQESPSQWQALRDRLRERQERLAELSQRMSDAAEAGRESLQMMPMEPEALEALARYADQLSERLPTLSTEDPDAWALQDLARFDAQREEDQAEIAALEAEMAALLAALHETGGDDLTRTREELAELRERLATRRTASRQLEQMSAAEPEMMSHERRVEALEQEIERLREQVAAAEAAQLDEVSEQQAEAEAEARAALEAARGMLEAGEMWDDDLFQLPDAPWLAPGEERTRTPTEADEVDERGDLAGDDEADDAGAGDRLADVEEEFDPQAWWDEPIDTPTDGTRWQIDERYADRVPDQPGDDPGGAEPGEREPGEADRGEPGDGDGWGEPTRREMLMAHQRALAEALSATRERVASARDEVASARSALASALASRDPAALEGVAASAEIGRAVAMAQVGLAQPEEAAGGADEDTGQPARRGFVLPVMGATADMEMEQAEVSDDAAAGRYRAALYRLPPELREPMRQGMRSAGPAAYQSLIEGYYRRLSERVEE